jgi:hypothetical protein
MALFRGNPKPTPPGSVKSDSAKRAYDSSPEFQRLAQENKQLRSALGRIRALESRIDKTESRLDAQEEWNSSCELTVKSQGRTLAAVMPTEFRTDCPCFSPGSIDHTFAIHGHARCFHCTESFDSPGEMKSHVKAAHHPGMQDVGSPTATGQGGQ